MPFAYNRLVKGYDRTKGLCPKFQSNWEGPYVVIHKLNDVICRIQKGPKCRPKVIHQDRLKPYHIIDWSKDMSSHMPH
jgi:hypothetical protein